MADGLTCILTLSNILGYFTCFNEASNGLFGIAVFYTLTIIIVGGWSLFRRLSEGMAIGGFFCSLIGVGLWVLKFINIKHVMFPVLILISGIFLLILSDSSND